MPADTVVVGAGAFGLSAALALAARGRHVRVLDPGPIPHPLAASTDISKVMRLAYGADELYTALAEEARAEWLRWNEERRRRGKPPLYRETGILVLTEAPMAPGGFEYESWQLLLKRGHTPQRIDPSKLKERFPAFRHRFGDGFFHGLGGYVESAAAIAEMADRAIAAGVELVTGSHVQSLLVESGAVRGVRDDSGERHFASDVVLAAGAWTARLLPELSRSLIPTAHALFYLRPRSPERFLPPRFPVFTADITRTGYYGFPLSSDGLVKIGSHGPGLAIGPDSDRTVPPAETERLRQFLREWLPDLADAAISSSRLCWYCDTPDGDFWIARHPEVEGLVVASGDSGHGFKFAPVLGRIVADAVEELPSPYLERFRWRPELRAAQFREAARYGGAPRA
ncbi:Monomeric sarcosine oxidase [bacterium HR33]|nr:Monomeric sarcosine oxidase [bacterium HR33]